MSQTARVRECDKCFNVCSVMDTVCPRCQQYGTLRDKYQCPQCRRLSDEKTCWVCAEAAGIREGMAEQNAIARAGDLLLPADQPMPDLRDPNAVPPWAAGLVGGAVLGGGVGAAASYFLDVDAWIAGIAGVLLGAVLGVLMAGSAGPKR